MQVGIFAKTFARPTLDETLDAVIGNGLRCVQFNLSCAGLPTLPASITPSEVDAIRHALGVRRIEVPALSGTFNLIHPDPAVVDDGIARLGVLAGVARSLDASIITLCTGTRNPENMWRWHAANRSADAWRDLLTGMERALAATEATGAILGVEPEISNVVESPQQARRLLDELRSPRVKIVMDGANLFRPETVAQMDQVLEGAFDLLGPDIVLAHAKELRPDGAVGDCAVGAGILAWRRYLNLLRTNGYTGPLIIHGVKETEAPASIAYLQQEFAT
ncbi:MAG: sugar phosphate isomerase/epimerase [Anaerolineales bacterium]|nr:sugar phosphate isomerase/epimerase [Anaerolineales bacterium]